MNKKKNSIYKLIWVILLIVAWEITTKFGMVNKYILPPFSEVILKLCSEFVKGTLLLQVWNSLKVVLYGFIISFVISAIVVVLCMVSKVFESFVMTICTICNPLPGVALMPVFMLWFGIGTGVLLALIFHAVAWPLITNLLSGLHGVPKIYTEWADNIECSLPNKIVHIYFYSIMPNLLSGLRIGWGRAWRALIAGEMVFGMIGELGGLGYYIYKARAYGNMESVYVGIVIIIIIGLFVEEFLFKLIDKHTIQKWGMTDGK